MLVVPGLAFAQQQLSAPPPTNFSLDSQGVDLVQGTYNLSSTDVVIGQPGSGGLTYSRAYVGAGWRDNLTGTINGDALGNYFVSVGGYSEQFILNNGVYSPVTNVGATLEPIPGDGFMYTTSNGIVFRFGPPSGSLGSPTQADEGRLNYIQFPTGERQEFTYRNSQIPGSSPPQTVQRLQSVTNNLGYQVKLGYALDTPSGAGDVPAYYQVKSATGFNMAVDWCAATSLIANCDFTETWPKATYGVTGSTQTVTDQSNRTTIYTFSANRVASLQSPAGTTPEVSIGYGEDGLVSSVSIGTGTWSYAWTDNGSVRTAIVTDPDFDQWTSVADRSVGRVLSFADPLLNTTTYSYLGGRIEKITAAAGNAIQYAYDARGNVISVSSVPSFRPTQPLPPLTFQASYPANCTAANRVICNLPMSTTDERLAVTNYTYDLVHGGVTSITYPAPTVGAVRPQTRFLYDQQYAWYKITPSVIGQAPTPVTVLATVSACATTATCAGTVDERLQVFAYGTSGLANNLLPTVFQNGAGAGSAVSTSTFGYTSDGDLAYVDGPLSGNDDTTRFRYDEARQLIGVIGPDPDAGGALLHRAQRLTYNLAGQVTLTERGTVTSFSDPAWAAFNSLQQVATVYDSYLRPIRTSQTAGGTTYAVAQTTYDSSNRASCTAIRMNPIAFGALPGSACTMGVLGGYGPDRIAQVTYDAASRPNQIVTGLGTPEVVTETLTYSVNGRVATVTDGKGNITSFGYDRYDRPRAVSYPNRTGGGISTTDFEQYTYDAASNVVSVRNRDGLVSTGSYDALNRLVSLTLPDQPMPTEDVTYAYDNFGRTLTASTPSQSITTFWDQLDRPTSRSGEVGAMTMAYDAAGRRTSLTWPDGFSVNYTFDLTNAMTAITRGSTTYAAYAYDNLGRRTSVTRPNGLLTIYGYDPASRLTSLAHDLPGTAGDQTYGYTYNPAGQIVSLSSSNSAYRYGGFANAGLGYANNGLNQVTQGGTVPIGYDGGSYPGPGNLTSDGVRTYSYDGADRLVASGSSTLSYDPLGRLREMTGTAGGRFLYDGVEVTGVAAAGSSVLTNRLIQGPWPDELVASVSGTTTLTTRWTLQDHLGSSVAITAPSGAAEFFLSYDDYGKPAAANGGRLMFTGQLWLPDFGVYHYKARAYHPGLGRFLQTDPIGYLDGLNLYQYVGDDPVNFSDPLGLQACGGQDEPDCQVDDVIVTGGCRRGWLCLRFRDIRLQVWTPFSVKSWHPRSPCPGGTYLQASLGGSASAAGAGHGLTAGDSVGVSFSPRMPIDSMQFFYQQRTGAGPAVGTGGSLGLEGGLGAQQGPMAPGTSSEGSFFAEGVTPYGSAVASIGPSGPQAGLNGDVRGRLPGLTSGSYVIVGAQATTTVATPPPGCS